MLLKRTVCLFLLLGAVMPLKAKNMTSSEAWLKNKFSQQHQQLLPKVTVANMFAACNKARKTDPVNYHIKDLVQKMSKPLLSEKLQLCLSTDSIQSEQAINFALIGCFSEQFNQLSEQEYTQNMNNVEQLLTRLPKVEKQKSLTKCVTMQAIQYLQ